MSGEWDIMGAIPLAVASQMVKLFTGTANGHAANNYYTLNNGEKQSRQNYPIILYWLYDIHIHTN